MDNFLKIYGKSQFNENVKIENIMTFGKYKNKSYDWIYENDKAYIVWILQTNEETRKYFIKPYSYFKNKIESGNI